MAIVQKNVQWAKEVDDVMVAVIEIVKDVKAGKSIAAIAAENFPLLVNAVNQAIEIPAELAESRQAVMGVIGYRGGELVDALVK